MKGMEASAVSLILVGARRSVMSEMSYLRGMKMLR